MGNPNSRTKKLTKSGCSSPTTFYPNNGSRITTEYAEVKPSIQELERPMAENPGLEEATGTGDPFKSRNKNGGVVKSLGFKSYKTGTLITANGEPS